MTVQDIKRGNFKILEGEGLKGLLEEQFGTEVEETDEGWHYVRFGALQPLGVRILSRSELEVNTESDSDVTPEVAKDSIRRYNRFLEMATGFNTKQRSKRLQKKLKAGKL